MRHRTPNSTEKIIAETHFCSLRRHSREGDRRADHPEQEVRRVEPQGMWIPDPTLSEFRLR